MNPRSLYSLWFTILFLLSACRSPQADAPIDLAFYHQEFEPFAPSQTFAVKLCQAMEEAERIQKLTPLVDLLDDDSTTALLAACVLVSLPDFGETKTVIAHLETMPSAEQAVFIYSLAFSQNKGTIDYLVRRLRKEPSDPIRKSAFGPLRIITGEDWTDDAKLWTHWWRNHRDDFVFPSPSGFNLRRFKTEVSKQQMHTITEAVARIVDADTPGQKAITGLFEDIFGGLERMIEKAGNIQRGAEAQEGIDLFLHSQFDEAVQAFRQALEKDDTDYFSRYILGSLLIELGQLQAARDQFDWIGDRLPNADLARFLSRFCEQRITSPKDPVLETLFRLLLEMEPNENTLWGWRDEFVEGLMGESHLGQGLFALDPPRLLGAAQNHPDNETVVVGTGVLLPEGVQLDFMRRQAARFPESVPVHLAWLNAWLNAGEDEHLEEIRQTVATLRRLEPDNAFFMLLEIYYTDYDQMRARDDSGNRLPLGDKYIPLFELAACSQRFVSYDNDLRKAAIDVLRHIQYPLAEDLVWHKKTSLRSTDLARLYVIRRVCRRAKVDRENGCFGSSVRLARHLVSVGQLMLQDAVALPEHHIAATVHAVGYAQLKASAEAEGRKAEADQFEQKWRQARPRFDRQAMTALLRLLSIPVPTFHRACVEAASQGEWGLLEDLVQKQRPSKKEHPKQKQPSFSAQSSMVASHSLVLDCREGVPQAICPPHYAPERNGRTTKSLLQTSCQREPVPKAGQYVWC